MFANQFMYKHFRPLWFWCLTVDGLAVDVSHSMHISYFNYCLQSATPDSLLFEFYLNTEWHLNFPFVCGSVVFRAVWKTCLSIRLRFCECWSIIPLWIDYSSYIDLCRIVIASLSCGRSQTRQDDEGAPKTLLSLISTISLKYGKTNLYASSDLRSLKISIFNRKHKKSQPFAFIFQLGGITEYIVCWLA